MEAELWINVVGNQEIFDKIKYTIKKLIMKRKLLNLHILTSHFSHKSKTTVVTII